MYAPILADTDTGFLLLLGFIGVVIGAGVFFLIIHTIIRNGVCAGMLDYRKKVKELEAKQTATPAPVETKAAAKYPPSTVMSGIGGKL